MSTNDLVTRLRALANDMSSDMTPPGVDPLVIYVRVSQGAKALREAADALEKETTQRRVANLNNEGNLARAEKAEAEAAALREALFALNNALEGLEEKP